MGSYGSSLRCQTCPTGFLSPPDWKCDGKCQKSMPKEKAEKILRDANKKGFHHLWQSDLLNHMTLQFKMTFTSRD